MIRCYVALGSNLLSPERQLRQALVQLRHLPRSVLIKYSPFYLSKPSGVRGQPHYVNLVVCLDTQLPATRLLALCQRIETAHHRLRKRRWSSRTLDIDLLLFGKEHLHKRGLIIPHPRMTQRDFVMVPLLDIAPAIKQQVHEARYETTILRALHGVRSS